MQKVTHSNENYLDTFLFICWYIAFEEDGFGSNPLFHAFVAVEKSTNNIVGYAVYLFTYATVIG